MKNAPRTSTFQSTLSVRRATGDQTQCHRDGNISIHALRKESDLLRERRNAGHVISIHALRKESDFGARLDRREPHYFNPRSP